MKILEDDCVGCPAEMGCLGQSCPKVNVPHYYCDSCGEEAELYMFEGEELCIDCILSRLDKVREWN